jgi:NitT/TauT family transport system permease protein
MKIFGKNIPMVLSLFVWMVIWELIGRSEVLFLIPPFTAVLKSILYLFTNQKFLDATVLSIKCLLLGVSLAFIVGIPLGILMARVKAAEELLSMWINVFVSAPLTALVPVLMVLFGIGNTTVVVTVFLFAVWVTTLDTFEGVKNVNPSLLEMGRSFGAGRFVLYTRIIVPAALPEILCGVRLGLIRGVRGLVVGQLLVAIVGVGELFELYSRNFLMDKFWALVIVVFLVAFGLAEIINYVERRIEFYAKSR